VNPRAWRDRVIVLPGGPGPEPSYLAALVDELGERHHVEVLRYPDLGALSFAAVLGELERALERGRAHLVGHSLGGLLALASAPRLGPRVASVVALSPMPAEGEALLEMAECCIERLLDLDLEAAVDRRRRRWPDEASAAELETFVAATRPLFASEAAWLEYRFHRSDALGFAELVDALLGNGELALGPGPAPIRLLWGEHDVIPRRYRDSLRASLGEPESLEVADAGHMLPVDQPRVVAEALSLWFARPASVTASR
jgi:pimeloyl-ACP methyl ester carboxylesterase